MSLNVRACMFCTLQSACLLWPYPASACKHVVATAAVGMFSLGQIVATPRHGPVGETTRDAKTHGHGSLSLASEADEEAPEKPGKRDPARIAAKLRAAQDLEKNGDIATATRLYRQAGLAGNGQAARRLCEIYSRGEGTVRRDYPKSALWCERARALGERKVRARLHSSAEIALLR